MNEISECERSILLVDDSPLWITSFGRLLEDEGFGPVLSCDDSRNALDMMRDNEIALVVLDLAMPHISGDELLGEIAENFPETPVIMMTGSEDIRTVVKCMKLGACDYFTKTSEPARLISGVQKAFELRQLRDENEHLRHQILDGTLKNPNVFEPIIARAQSMRAIFQYIEAMATSPEAFLITGESGVGKELIAEAVHAASGRSVELVSVNVAGLDDAVFADTLFGHKKGAFTGAMEARAGLIECAARGTLFLDEIGDLTRTSQVKLLRLLQEREYYPAGSDNSMTSSARIVVATNRDFEEMRLAGEFWEDLYYRLHTHHVHVPPLRDRREDLDLLADFFMAEAAKTLDKKLPSVPKQLYTLLSTYDFSGNVRELKAMLMDAVGMHQSGILSLDSIRAHIRRARPSDKSTGPIQRSQTVPGR